MPAAPTPSEPTTVAAPNAEAHATTPEAPVAHEAPTIADAPTAPDAPDTAAAPQAQAIAHAAHAGATPPTAPHTVEAREHIHGVGQPLRSAIRTLPKDGKPNTISLTVRLDPPELGAVRVRVVAQGERVHVTLHAESPEAQAALEQRHQDVAELLRHDGFNLEGFDVESHDNNRRQDAPEQRRGNRAEEFVAEPETAAAEDDKELRL
jgi:flagellar hook-length control protein FliK